MTMLPRDCTFSPQDWQVLAGFWYPVIHSSDVQTHPVSVKLLDQDIVLYRSSTGVVAAKDICIHRGVQISKGWLEEDELVCPYHGFRYGSGGQCTFIPAAPEQAIPSKLRLLTLHAQERYGLVWVCLATTPTHPIPYWQEFDDPSYRVVHMEALEWDASAARHTENFNDMAHISWVHHETFGDRNRPQVPHYPIESRDYGLHAQVPYWQKNRRASLGGEAHLPTLYTYDLYLPFFTRLQVQYTEGKQRALFDLAVPVSAKKTKAFLIIAQNPQLQQHENPEDARVYMRQLMAEDKDMVESQRPEELPLDLMEEFHLRFDRMSTAYRKALTALGLGKPLSS